MKTSVLLFVSLLTVLPLFAQPKITGIVNAASFTVAGLPNSAIAQGSMFIIFGTGLGPSTLTQASSFPLQTNLAGTSVNINTVSFAGSANALMIYTSANQIAAILPSTLNYTGNVVVTVTYNGQTSSTAFLNMTTSTFGAFTVSQSGRGPAVAYNYNSSSDQPLNTFATPATPGQVVTLWGTGLGPVKGNEAGGPLPGQLNLNLQLYVGGQAVSPSYYGRSGCCAGIDQVVFAVPNGVIGCQVPVAVVINGIVSNTTTISVSSDGSACSDPLGPSSGQIQTASGGATRFGNITLTHTTGGNPTDSGAATFGSTNFAGYAASLSGIPVAGSCLLVSGNSNSASAPSTVTPLDAGPSLQVSGPGGAGQLTKQSNGAYSGTLPGVSAGAYTVTGSGGADVGAFTANITVPGGGSWNAAAAPSPGNPFVVTWTGSVPNATMEVSGITANTNNGLFGLFLCTAPSSAGTLTVPGYITAGMPSGQGIVTVSESGVSSFTAPGISQGYIGFTLGGASSVFTFGSGGGGTKE